MGSYREQPHPRLHVFLAGAAATADEMKFSFHLRGQK